MDKVVYFVLFLAISLGCDGVAGNCPFGWMQYSSSCYLFHRSPLTWLDSASYCRVHGAHLARVDSHSEKDFINGILQNLPGQYWLDGVDDQAEGIWEWASTGHKITINLWTPGEPNHQSPDEDCMETADYRNGLWNDDNCHKHEYSICEKSVS